MNKQFTVYRLPFTVRYPFTVYRFPWLRANGKWLKARLQGALCE